ncbi:MAG TPA: hypothetical protein VFA23_03330 [Dongiaceae bacterium]|nr:hypothetical protein [Dongiaceae bacterium]
MIASAVLFALILGLFVFLVLPYGRPWQRAISAAVFLVLVVVVFGGSVELLSRPKPLRLEWRDTREAQVVSASLREGQGIYIWIEFDGSSEPRSYILPWNIKTAQQLQTAMRQGQARGTAVKMSMPGASAGLDDREPKFYAKPQQPLPDKSYNQSSPIVYQPSDHL